MAVTTMDYAKAGTTEFWAFARDLLPATGDHWDIESGDERFVEDGEGRTFKTFTGAHRWLRKRAPEATRMVGADIREVNYIKQTFEDDEYGVVYDAESRIVHQWDYWMDETRTLLLSDDYDVSE